MHPEILVPAQLQVLDGLSAIPAVREFYLGGGTALALRHGHRRSVDFDFFRDTQFDVEALAAALDGEFSDVQRLPTGEQTLYMRLVGVTTSFFWFPYSLLDPTEPTQWGFGLASDGDLAAMKIEAIAGRGSRRDFVDLRLLCRLGRTLDEMFDLFDRKYGAQRTDRYQRLLSLSYFDDAEAEPLPDMLIDFDWDEAKRFFTAQASRMMSEYLGAR
jgi:hypothetical protein